MNEIFVAGHRNPDMDCTCSAVAYADLKNRVDPGNTYRPIRSGPLSTQIRKAFARAGIEPPAHYDSVDPTVDSVVRQPEAILSMDAPLLEAVRMVRDRTISAVPVLDDEENFIGLIGVNEIADFVLTAGGSKRPVHEFKVSNFEKVLSGRLVKRGDVETFSAPIMTGSMPLRQTIARLSALPYKPLLVVGNRSEIIAFAVEKQLPAIVVTGVRDQREIGVSLDDYHGSLFLSDTDTAESIRLVRFSSPVASIVDTEIPRVEGVTPFDTAKRMLLDSPYRGLPVFEGEEFTGIVTRRSFIERPRRRMILVDHNELPQAVPGAEGAEILEIVDHHRLSAPITTTPITVTTRPVGSTCTLVYQEYQTQKMTPDKDIAVLLLSGILSDTVNLHSPTTTEADRSAVSELEKVTGLDGHKYAIELFSQLAALQSRDPHEIVQADFKTYEERGFSFGIGQVEVTTLSDSDAYVLRLSEALRDEVRKRNLKWALLMVTDVIKRNSLLISSGYPEAEKRLTFVQEFPGLFRMPEVVSRKKQLLPEVIRVLEEVSSG